MCLRPYSVFALDIHTFQLGAASRHVRTTARLAALPGGLAAGHHRTSAGHQLRVGSGVMSHPCQGHNILYGKVMHWLKRLRAYH